MSDNVIDVVFPSHYRKEDVVVDAPKPNPIVSPSSNKTGEILMSSIGAFLSQNKQADPVPVVDAPKTKPIDKDLVASANNKGAILISYVESLHPDKGTVEFITFVDGHEGADEWVDVDWPDGTHQTINIIGHELLHFIFTTDNIDIQLWLSED